MKNVKLFEEFEEFVNEAEIGSNAFNEGLAFLRTVDYQMTEDGAEILIDPKDKEKLKEALSAVFG